MAANPFANDAATVPKMLHLYLSRDPPKSGAVAELAQKAQAGERVVLAGGALWIDYGVNGVGNSKLTPLLIDKACGSPATGRNLEQRRENRRDDRKREACAGLSIRTLIQFDCVGSCQRAEGAATARPFLCRPLGSSQPFGQEVDKRADFAGRTRAAGKDGVNVDPDPSCNRAAAAAVAWLSIPGRTSPMTPWRCRVPS